MSSFTIRYPSDNTNVKEESINGYTYLTLSHPVPDSIQLVRAPLVQALPEPVVMSPRMSPVVRTSTTRVVSTVGTGQFPALLPPPVVASPPRALVPQPAFSGQTVINTPSGPMVVQSPTYINTPGGPVISSVPSSPTYINTPAGPVISSVPAARPMISSVATPRSLPVSYMAPAIVSQNTLAGANCIGQENTLIVKVKQNVNVDELIKTIENYEDVKCTEVRAHLGNKVLVIHFNDRAGVMNAYQVLVDNYGLKGDVEPYY